MDSKDTRLFDDEEIGAILKRASQIQGGLKAPTETGLSLEELDALCQDATRDSVTLAPALETATSEPSISETIDPILDLEQMDDPEKSAGTDRIEKRSKS